MARVSNKRDYVGKLKKAYPTIDGETICWTHELGSGMLLRQCVIDSQGVDLGPVQRCNVKTGHYVPDSGEYRDKILQADAPLRVVSE